MEHLMERLDVDEGQLKKVARANGTHVTWLWVIGVLLALVAFLGGSIIVESSARVDRIEARQSDVRERLQAIEALLRRHTDERLKP
jgi:hypothetical protein